MAYEAYYNVVLENHKLRYPTCLESEKNGIKNEKLVKKGAFSNKDLQLGSYDGFLQLLSISQQFSIDIILIYIYT